MPSTMSSYTPIDHSDAVGTVVHGTGYNVNTPQNEPSHDRARPRSFSREDEQSLQDVLPTKKAKEVVTWRSLPHKRQLTILTLARLSEPLVQSSLRVSPNPAIGLARLTHNSPISSTNSSLLTGPSLILSLPPKRVLCRERLQLPNYARRCYGGAGLTGEDAKESS